ncbi:branched-chain amino acid transport system substrate-binding protein [Actinoplanes lutulentus]|uniref:Amino acid/amide ABC transporter substrate-binding protein (HAAT family) n=1 Tax=Actinoplanes lutulentus TaxID=1287878 RepID=A0A327ZBU8_9ACTN|nr:branched-chain amino acid ABC transporter substrate-binding protein [Actinoplanes lutulentus]MBB2946645.1 branched-chain amino acid transport system substrate-binding protein [Actinoplanes lutulentus]RAK35539.1 amino acid/amide ABC transporter substrate-binding protein (HAAT family) [Actinoplanes lutulentus]
MQSRIVLGLTTAALVSAVLAACGSPDQDSSDRAGKAASEASATTIRLGSVLPLTGRSNHSGESMRNGAQLAVDELNAAGGVLGKQIELVTADDACDPGTAVSAAQDIVKDGIAVSVGGYCSSAVVPTLRIFRDAGIPMVIAQANSTDLTEPGYDSVFLICGTVGAEAVFAVDRIHRLGGSRLAVVHDGTSFSLTLADSSVAEAKRTKTLTITDEIKLSQGAPDYERIAQTVISGKADTVYFTGYYAEANQLIKDLRAQGFRGRIVVGDGATDGPLLNDLTTAQSTGVYGTALLFPELMPTLKEWSARYKAAFGTSPGPSTVEAYDAVQVAVDAIRRAGSSEPSAIRQALTTTDTTVVSGEVSFRADGTRTVPTFLLLRAEDQAFVLDALTDAN